MRFSWIAYKTILRVADGLLCSDNGIKLFKSSFEVSLKALKQNRSKNLIFVPFSTWIFIECTYWYEFKFFNWSLIGPIFSPVLMKLLKLLFIIEGMGNFMPNVVAVLKDVNRFGKHAFISDSSDEFRFYPRNSIQINPGFRILWPYTNSICQWCWFSPQLQLLSIWRYLQTRSHHFG